MLIHLISDDLGSISIGASVYFKKMPVGKIYDYRFNKDNKVEIDVVIDKAFAHFVKKDSRFWNISGINANINSSGMNAVSYTHLALSFTKSAAIFSASFKKKSGAS